MKTLKKNRFLLAIVLTVFAAVSAILGLNAFGKKTALAEDTATETFVMEDGVSAKLSADGGIRFRVKMDVATGASVQSGEATLQIVVAPYYYFDKSVDYAIEHGRKIDVEKTKIYEENGSYYANGCITNILEANRKLNLQAIAVISSGETTKQTAVNANAKGNIYDVLTSAVLDANGDYEKTIFKIAAYDWFGTQDYPITVLNDTEYAALVAKFAREDGFKNKYYRIIKTVNYNEADFSGISEHVDFFKAANAITFTVANMDITYPATPSPSATAKGGDVTFTYSKVDESFNKVGDTGDWNSVYSGAGKYCCIASTEGDDTYGATTAEKYFTVNKADNKITWTSDSMDVDYYPAIPKPQATAKFGTITYTYQKAEDSEGFPKVGEAGDWATIGSDLGIYWCIATVQGTDDYKEVINERPFRVTKAVRDIASVEYTYDSTTKTYYVSSYTGSSDTVEVLAEFNDGVNGEAAVTHVGAKAFDNDFGHAVKKVVLPESITELKGLVFFNCAELEYLSMPGVTAFTGENNNITHCHNLKTLIVKEGITIPAQQLQSGNESIKGVTTVYVNGTKAITIENADLNKLIGNIYYLGDGVKCGTWKFGDNGEIVKGAAAHNYVDGVCDICGEKDAMGVVYTYDSASDSYYVAGYTGSATEITVFGTWNDGTHSEKNVTYVAFGAFSGNSTHNAANYANCKKIKKIVLPESVTDLGGWVFAECESLEYLDARGVKNILYTIIGNRPDGVNGSDNNFRCCYKLTTLIIGDGFESNVGQFTTDGSATINLYVYGSNAIKTRDNDNALTGNIYYYSETQKSGAWHFDSNGNVALWQAA